MQETKEAIHLAQQAGEILRGGWGRKRLRVEQKGIINPVSEIDRQSEALIVSFLQENYPEDSILSEEGIELDRGGESRWIIDPLDGTINYLHRYPMVAVSIGLEKKGEMVLGVVFNPILDELFVAEKGRGATLNGSSIHVSKTGKLVESVLASGFPYDALTSDDDNTREWSRFVKRCCSVRCNGTAAVDLCYVACGRLDGYWERGLYPWDIAAGIVIAREAGAWVGDYRGGEDGLRDGEIVAANEVLAGKMRGVLAE